MPLSIAGLERALMDYCRNDTDLPFNIKSVPIVSNVPDARGVGLPSFFALNHSSDFFWIGQFHLLHASR